MNFKCPQCGGPYFGRDTSVGEDGKPVILDTVQCHGAEDGGHLMYHDEKLNLWRLRGVKPCRRRGVWPPKESDVQEGGGCGDQA